MNSVGPESSVEAEKSSKGEGGAGERTKKVPILKLFAYADGWDYFLMALGSIGACAHGAAVPVFFIFFGKLINIIGIAYLYPTTVSHRVAKYSQDFVYLGIVVLFSSWTEVACWMHTGERQAAKMRVAYLRAMLEQDISVFDTEVSTGEVISAITSDIIIVQDAISEKALIVGSGGAVVRGSQQPLLCVVYTIGSRSKGAFSDKFCEVGADYCSGCTVAGYCRNEWESFDDHLTAHIEHSRGCCE